MCRRAFKAGAAEFLEKPVDDEPCSRRCTTPCASMCARASDAAGREARERYALLSPREREVLSLVVAGLTNKEIGRALVLSPAHRGDHRAHLCSKLGGADAGADDPQLRAAGGRRRGPGAAAAAA
jgi:two-component system response regulator FixJ